ncbi:Uncharacterized protein TCM_006484 [Theobroma cacao]|uniref:Uncharacterized protein n=1 Tax=Theobroma cacao TaxID=3641 RepID=A0A061DXF0_THECC|nr:Uncharacterized protein TCM_006484 [Theobroma cacao]
MVGWNYYFSFFLLFINVNSCVYNKRQTKCGIGSFLVFLPGLIHGFSFSFWNFGGLNQWHEIRFPSCSAIIACLFFVLTGSDISRLIHMNFPKFLNIQKKKKNPAFPWMP